MENEKKPIVSEEEFYDFFRKILCGWRSVIKISILFFVIGIVIAFSRIKEYTATVSVAPESSEGSSLGSIGALASMAGFDINGLGGSDDALYPLLYPDIVNSLPFITSLLETKVQSVDGDVDSTYYYYRKNIYRQSWISKCAMAPKKLIKVVLSSFKKADAWSGNADVFDPYYLSEKQLSFIESINDDMLILVDKKTDVITLSFTAQDPKVAAIMVEDMRAKLQESITNYRIQKALSDHNYVAKIYNESKKDYETAQMAYAEYCDKNRNVTSERFQVEKERLEADKELKNTVFSQWSQQLQLSKAKIQQNTPAFTILKSASIPAIPSTPRKLTTMVLFIFLGILSGICYVAFREPVCSIYKKLFCNTEQ